MTGIICCDPLNQPPDGVTLSQISGNRTDKEVILSAASQDRCDTFFVEGCVAHAKGLADLPLAFDPEVDSRVSDISQDHDLSIRRRIVSCGVRALRLPRASFRISDPLPSTPRASASVSCRER